MTMVDTTNPLEAIEDTNGDNGDDDNEGKMYDRHKR